MYIVTFDKLAIAKDGTVGNVSQGQGMAYMNCSLTDIEVVLSDRLAAEKTKPVVVYVNRAAGIVIETASDEGAQ